jgi:alpha-glucosidase
MNAAAHNAIRNFQPDKRPWLLSRSGWAGLQRYAWKWTADVQSTWEALKMTIATVSGFGVSGIPYSGSDIGGFSGDPEPELYIRWFQMSALMALFRNHTAISTTRGEPWQYGDEAVEICREMLALRKRLIPYLYTLSWDAAMTGAPFVRPMVWAEPDDPRFWQVDDSYLLGNSILVAPVLEPGAVSRSVLLPEGGWYHYWDEKAYQGGREVEVSAPLDQIPFFIKAGSVVPMAEDDGLVLHLYPPIDEGESSSHLYLDDGDGFGPSRTDHFLFHRRANRLFLQWRMDGIYPAPDQVRIVLHGALPKIVRVDEQPVEWPEEGLLVAPFENLKIILQ